MKRITFVIGLVLLSGTTVWSQGDSIITQVLLGVVPVPNGLTDLGLVAVDARRLSVLALDPQLIMLNAPGQSQQVIVTAVLSDRSAYYVTSSAFGTTYSVDDSSVATVTPDGRVVAVADGSTVLNAFHLGRQVRSFIVVDQSAGEEALAVIPSQLSLGFIGAQQQLLVSSLRSDGNIADVTLHSSTTYRTENPAVATVTRDGVVTAAGSGTAIIRIDHGIASGSATVSVSIQPGDALVDLEVSAPSFVLRSTTSVQLIVTGIRQNESMVILAPSLTGTFYQTTISSVAIVSNEGLVTAVNNGNTRILVNNGGLSATIDIRVSLSSLDLLVVEPSSRSVPLNALSPSFTLQLTLKGRFSDGGFKDITPSTAGTSYVSSDLGIANVNSSGLVSFMQPGSVVIIALNSNLAAQASFTVTRFDPAALGKLSGDFTSAAALGQLAVLSGAGSLQIASAASPADPVVIGSSPALGLMVDVAVLGARAYATETSGLAVFDLSDPVHPARVFTLPGSSIRSVATEGGRLYFTDGTSLRVHDAASLVELGRFDGLPSSGEALAVSGGLAFVAGGSGGLHIVEVSTPSSMALAKTVAGSVFDVASKGRRAFITGASALLEVDAAVSTAAAVTAQSGLAFSPTSVAVRGDLAFAGASVFRNDVAIFNISQPGNLPYIGAIDFPGFADGLKMDVSESLVYQVSKGAGAGLYVGIYKPDEPPSPPSVTLLSPAQGAQLVEGALVQVSASATDNFGIEKVTYFVDGVAQSTATLPPFSAVLRIPLGTSGRSVRISAQARDLSGLLSPFSEVLVASSPDPLTAVAGRLVTVFGDPVSNAQVTIAGQLMTTSGADGHFVLSHVPTVQTSLTLSSTATAEGFTVFANAKRAPVLGGLTDFGDVILSGNLTLSGNVWELGSYLEPPRDRRPDGARRTNAHPAGRHHHKFPAAAKMTVSGSLITQGSNGGLSDLAG